MPESVNFAVWEPIVRLAAFLGVFAVMASWEALAPRRARLHARLARWPRNLGIMVINTLVVRLLFPTAAVGFALLARERGWGLFNALGVNEGIAAVLALIALDFVIYLQHVMFHAVPALWRLHRVHHADPDFDVTTGARFHPLEIVLSMLIKFATIAALGPPAIAVLVFEIALNASALFNHANVKLPVRLDSMLRWAIVTPDMHRIHHSQRRVEADSNYGFNLSWWDRLLGTYTPAAREPQESMGIGVAGITGRPEAVTLRGMLTIPLAGESPSAERSFGQPHVK